MATTAILVVSTDASEYSRYGVDPGEHQVTVRFLPQGPAAGDVFSVSLLRKDGYGAVATRDYTWLGTERASIGSLTFDLVTDCFDTNGIYRAVQGDYTASVVLPADPTVTATSDMFAVSLIGVQEMKRTWLYGMNLLASEIKLPRQQPQVVTGVTVLEVSPSHPNIVYPLVYTVAVNAPNVALPNPAQGPGQASSWGLSWGSGQPVPLAPGVRGLYSLLDEKGEDWVQVQVDPFLLPNSSVSENLLIESARLTDRDIIRYVRLATGRMEQELAASYPVEPRYVSTDSDPTLLPAGQAIVEELVIGSTWERPGATGANWLQVKLTKRGILNLAYLQGFMQSKRVMQVPASDWAVLSEKAGRVDLVPATGAAISWMLYGQPFFAFLFNYDYVPSFWHWGGVCGLRDLFGKHAMVREAIAKMAAIEIMLVAGSAYKAGYSSQSTGRDGVSESASYTSSAQFGIYAHVAVPYGQWLDNNLPRLRKRIMGIQMTTLQ